MSTWTDPNTAGRPSGRHPVNVGHLVMGLALLGLVGVWALVQADIVTGDDIRWLLPIPWVIAGAAGLIAIAVGSTRRYTVHQAGWVDTTNPPTHTPADTTADTTAEIPEETR